MALITSNKVYDWLKYASLVFLPAVNVLYVALATVWGWSHTQEVSTSVLALNAFLGTLVGVSSAQHTAGK